MISDVLSTAHTQIARYLREIPACYPAPIRGEILALLEHMDRIRQSLDTPPAVRMSQHTERAQP